ncbi:MAG: hypothetical protein O7A03_08410, partial [Alphaproteobacteria bacterium]|nr:hypothetical protein [Alphaproteobacteria bacterium]
MDVMDLRGCPVPEIGNTLLAAYDAARPGERVAVRVDAADTALAMWLIEAGAHFETETQSDGVLVTATRAMSPALTAAPGVHHLIDDG